MGQNIIIEDNSWSGKKGYFSLIVGGKVCIFCYMQKVQIPMYLFTHMHYATLFVTEESVTA